MHSEFQATRSNGLDIISFTFVRNMKMRCRSSSLTDARALVEQFEELPSAPNPTRMVRAHRDAFDYDSAIPANGFPCTLRPPRWDPPHCACLGRAYEALGSHEFVAQGGDWGAVHHRRQMFGAERLRIARQSHHILARSCLT